VERASFTDMHCSSAQSLEVGGAWWAPAVIDDQVGGGPNQRGRLDAPPRDRARWD